LYGLSAKQDLYRIDKHTGRATFVKSLGFVENSAIDLATDPVSSNLVTYPRHRDGFVQIDRTTGNTTLLNGADGFGIDGLDFDSSGTLFGTDALSDDLATFDLASGAKSFIGYIPFDYGGGLTFNAANELFFLGGHDTLVKIDTGDASTETIAYLGSCCWMSQDFDEANTLYAVRRQYIKGGPITDLYIINPSTGVPTLVTRIRGLKAAGDSIIGLSFAGGAPSSVSGFTWPIDPFNPTTGHDGGCGDWPGVPQACFWVSNSSEDTNTAWRDVQPFQRNFNSQFNGYHLGADYNLGSGNGDAGRNVYPVAPGYVVAVRVNECGWGNIIFVRHDTANGTMTSMYAHVDWLPEGAPVLNQDVVPSVPIARVGNGAWNCGQASRGKYPYHLHLEIREGLSLVTGHGYSTSRVTTGPQGQLDPNAIIRSQ
jgi:murein DD-endopeptidase MepM/ murein hydrolase activator NlpD